MYLGRRSPAPSISGPTPSDLSLVSVGNNQKIHKCIKLSPEIKRELSNTQRKTTPTQSIQT